jgi:hypothetical protein
VATLYFDGDKRRIYEVPTDSTFIVDVDGFRVYSGPGEADSQMTATYMWSEWVDWHFTNQWTTLAFEKSGGAFRFATDGGDVYATFDLRLANQWAFVPANYKHDWTILGNIFENDEGLDFDADRITAAGVSSRIFFADSLQILNADGGGSSPLYLIATEISVFKEVFSVSAPQPFYTIGIDENQIVPNVSDDSIQILMPPPISIKHGC